MGIGRKADLTVRFLPTTHCSLALCFLCIMAVARPAAADFAVLQGLDKITARISTFNAPLDYPVRFGSLEIIARTCKKTPPEEPPESAAFLEVTDVRPDSEAIALFAGWMFASSPAISALEHPVYDVWVIDCGKGDPPPEPEEEASGAARDKTAGTAAPQ